MQKFFIKKPSRSSMAEKYHGPTTFQTPLKPLEGTWSAGDFLKWQSTPVFLPGEPHGQRSLAGYSP